MEEKKQDKLAIYQNRQTLSLFEAACLAHHEDPEEAFNSAWYSIDPEIRKGLAGRGPEASAALVEAMRDLLLGEIGKIWGELRKAFDAPGKTQKPVVDIQAALALMGLALPIGPSHAPRSIGKQPDPRMVDAYYQAAELRKNSGNKAQAVRDAINAHFPNENDTEKIRLIESLKRYLAESGRPKWAERDG